MSYKNRFLTFIIGMAAVGSCLAKEVVDLFEAVKNMKPKSTSEGFWPADKCNED